MDPVFGTLDSDYFNHSLSNQCTSEVCVCDVENPEFSFELEEFSDNCDPEESCTFIWPPFAEHNTDEDEGEQLNDFKATDIQYKNKVCSDYPHTGKIQSIKVWSPFGSDGYGIDSFKGLKRVRYDEDVIFVASSSAEDYSVRIFCLNTSHIAEPKPTCSNSISVDKITFLAFIKQTGSTHIELDSNKGLLMGVRRKNDTKNGVDSFRPELSRSKNKYKHNHKSNRPKLNSNTTGDDGVSPNERTTGSSSRKDASYWTPLLRLSVSDVRYWFYALFKLLYRTIFNIIKSLIVYQKIESYLKKQPKFKFIEAIYNIIRGWGFLDRGDTDIYFQATNNSDIFGELGHLGLSNDFELSSSKGDSSSRSKNSKAGGAQNGSLGSNSAVGYRSTSQFSWELWTFDLFVLFGNTLYTKPEYQNIDSSTNKCSQALTGDKQSNTNANTNSDCNGNGNGNGNVGTDATSNSNGNDSSNNIGNNNNGNALLPSTFYPLISPSISSFIPSYLQKINILSMNLPLNLSIQLPSYYKYQSKTDPLTQYSPPNTVVYSASDICIDFNPAPLFDSLPLQLQLHSASSPLVEPTTHADDMSSHSSFDPLSDHPSVNSMAANMNPAASNNLGASLRDSLFNRFHFDTNTPFVVIKSIKLVQSGTPRDYSRYVDSISNFNNIVNTSANANATTPLNTSTSVNNSNLVNTDNVSNVSGISGRNHTSNLYRGYNSDASQKSTTHGPKNPIDTDSKSAGLTHSFSYTVLAVASGNTIKLISV
ncbi:hypothetical protein AX774_g7030 [Zancudomyces culisetae]|uniref:Uncharacterized protein n=1 Tax=Zancudomyces culisetae TaxID=1213189 RepID=A0A1R1PEX9_ZANCU|nr:hypothetical protein AX774_g7030 [Zancudomyces culisetae]|eukprot:OMH79555.1 hypothetical protein AX774_g7030 [Zancudomyces culisetae]